jgi:LacI family transcriptional regulator
VVILANSGDRVDRQDAILKRMREHGVDGIILCPAADTKPDLLRKIQDWNLPLVQVLRHISDEIDYVGVDYSSGMRQAVDYLASLGHQAIAFAVHGPVHSAYRERIDGFRMAMEARGLSSDLVVRVPYQTSSIPQSVHLIFDRAVKPSAVVCFNDVIALALAAGLHDRGLSVGSNFSLVGFDDVVDAETMRPRLTSVSTAPVSIGEHAAGIIIDRLGNRQRPPRRIISPAVLNIRQSCVDLSAYAPQQA